MKTGLSASPFVGRVPELDALRRSLPDAGGAGRLVTVAGEAGIGKTRLIGEIAEIAIAHGKRVLWSQLIEEPGAPPYFSWMLALRSCVRQSDDDTLRANLGSGAADVADIVPELRDRLNIDECRAKSDSASARYQLFDSVTRFLLSSAEQQPLLILFDNLQSADRSSLAMLEYFCQQISGSPIMVVGALREADLDRHHPLRAILHRLARSAGYFRLVLEGLSRTEVAELFLFQLGEAPPAALVDSVYEQSDGNPLFVTEVGSMLSRQHRETATASAGYRFNVPASLRDVIGARLDALPDESCELLRIAAVLGREFELATLAELASVGSERASRQLQHAATAGVVSSLGPGKFCFHHILFREVLYAELNMIARVMLHRRAGEQLEKRTRDNLKPRLSELAFHFFESAQFGNAEKAITYCIQAAEEAISQRAYGDAVALFDCALQAFELEEENNDERRFDLLQKTGRAMYQSGQLNGATQTLIKAAILAYRNHWWEKLASALYLFQLVCQQSGYRHVSSVPLHKAALEQLPEESRIIRARVMASLANAYRTAAQPRLATEMFRKSVALARQCDDPSVLLDCLRKGNWTVGRNPQTVQEGLKISREALALAKSQDNPEAMLDSVVDIIFQLCDLGQTGEVQDQLVVLRQISNEGRLPHFRNVLTGFETALAILRGKWVDALRLAKEGVSQLPLQGVRGLQGRFAFQIFAIKKAQGSLGPLQDVAERIIAESSSSQLWLPGQILLHCEMGQLQQAREAMQEIGDFRKLPEDDLLEIALIYLAEAATKLGDLRRCSELYERLTPFRGLNVTLPGTIMLGAVAGYMAPLAVATRRWADARSLFEEAITMNSSMGALPALARTQVDFARFLLWKGSLTDDTQARRLIADARAIAQDLGLCPVLLSIDEMSANCGAESLTGREVDVLKLIATGSSNNGIAEALNISHSTVATHVRNIFRKIKVANRTEAAGFARRAGVLDHN